jgi:acetyl-CoA synthetase
MLLTLTIIVRTLMRFDADPIADYDLSSLRILGSVGEPINPEAWRWYHDHIACCPKNRSSDKPPATICDTYWQTETGAHICTNLPGVMNMKPGSCALPCYGIEFAILDPTVSHINDFYKATAHCQLM